MARTSTTSIANDPNYDVSADVWNAHVGDYVSQTDTSEQDLASDLNMNANDILGAGDVKTASSAGVAETLAIDIPVGAGGAADAELAIELHMDGTEEAGLHAETDGAGSYRNPVFAIPHETDTNDWTAPTLPTNAPEGSMKVAYNSTLDETRLWIYSNSTWTSMELL